MHRTDAMTITLERRGAKPRIFTMPAALAPELVTFIKDAGKLNRTISADVVFPVLADNDKRPATVLRGSRYKEGMTQQVLAGLLDIRQSHLSEMENNKRPIGKNMAKKLASVFACDYRVFI